VATVVIRLVSWEATHCHGVSDIWSVGDMRNGRESGWVGEFEVGIVEVF
jgi:hypothetical protein